MRPQQHHEIETPKRRKPRLGFMAALLLLALLAADAVAVAAAASSGDDDGDEPISEAQKLYCDSCRASCGASRLAAETQARSSKRINKGEQDETEAARVRLECSCQTVFDLERKSFICKNMSQADAKIQTNRPTGGQHSNGGGGDKVQQQQPSLETRAFARSQASGDGETLPARRAPPRPEASTRTRQARSK